MAEWAVFRWGPLRFADVRHRIYGLNYGYADMCGENRCKSVIFASLRLRHFRHFFEFSFPPGLRTVGGCDDICAFPSRATFCWSGVRCARYISVVWMLARPRMP